MPERYVPQVTRVEVAGRTLKLTSLDKLLFPSTETTKGEVLSYYAQVADVLLPHLADRALTRVRWPHGTGDQSFFEKNLPSGAPSWLPRVTIDDVTYPMVEDLAQLTYLVNLNSIELHIPQWRVARRRARSTPTGSSSTSTPAPRPACRECAQVAIMVRDRLGDLGLDLFPVTSGSKGMQLYAGLPGRPHVGPDPRPRHAARAGADQEAPRPHRLEDDQVAAARARSSSTGARTSPPRRPSAPTRCAARRPRRSRPRGRGTRSRPAPEGAKFEQLMFDEVLDRLESDGDLLADLLA